LEHEADETRKILLQGGGVAPLPKGKLSKKKRGKKALV